MRENSPQSHTLPIRVAQLNTERSTDITTNLLNEFTNDFDLFILQEPAWSRIGADNGQEIYGSVQLQGWTPIAPTYEVNPQRPRTFAFIKNRIDFSVTLRTDLAEDCDIQILDVLQHGHPTVTIINIYNDAKEKRGSIMF